MKRYLKTLLVAVPVGFMLTGCGMTEEPNGLSDFPKNDRFTVERSGEPINIQGYTNQVYVYTDSENGDEYMVLIGEKGASVTKMTK